MKKYYVYKLIDPTTNNPFYVGKGCGTRSQDHLKYNSKDDCLWNKRLGSFIGKLKIENKKPIIEIYSSNLEEDEALSIEEDLIKSYGRKNIDEGGILLNFIGHRSGSTISRPPVSEETRQKLSKLHKGRKQTAEAKANSSTSAKARMLRMKADGSWAIVVEKNAIAHTGKVQSTATVTKRSASIKAFKDTIGGKYIFSEQARKNIGASQLGNDKHAKNWMIKNLDGRSVSEIRNLTKWMAENNLVKMKDGIRLKDTSTGLIVFTAMKV
jgi:hypothetical protein